MFSQAARMLHESPEMSRLAVTFNATMFNFAGMSTYVLQAADVQPKEPLKDVASAIIAREQTNKNLSLLVFVQTGLQGIDNSRKRNVGRVLYTGHQQYLDFIQFSE